MDYKKASISVAEGKVPTPKKIACGVGEFADACVYTVFYTYFLFFLTDVKGTPFCFEVSVHLTARSLQYQQILLTNTIYYNMLCVMKTITRIDSAGRLVIPKELRKRYGFESGQRIRIDSLTKVNNDRT
jgi:hypothetical protein